MKVNKEVLEYVKNNNGYCPCRVEKCQDNKCPCLEFRTTKKCICGLFEEEKHV